MTRTLTTQDVWITHKFRLDLSGIYDVSADISVIRVDISQKVCIKGMLASVIMLVFLTIEPLLYVVLLFSMFA